MKALSMLLERNLNKSIRLKLRVENKEGVVDSQSKDVLSEYSGKSVGVPFPYLGIFSPANTGSQYIFRC